MKRENFAVFAAYAFVALIIVMFVFGVLMEYREHERLAPYRECVSEARAEYAEQGYHFEWAWGRYDGPAQALAERECAGLRGGR